MENNVIILAGGQGKRMKTNMPKALCNVIGEPMLEWVLTACENAELDDICVVKGYEGQQIEDYLDARKSKANICTVMQEERLGTGHAVMQAADFLKAHAEGNTLILCGDAPFIDAETIKGALELHTEKDCGVTVVTSRVENPTGYGRIIRTENGISGIVEHKDCTPMQLAITEINSGCYWFKTADLLEVLFDIKPENAQGEYYLTDCIELLIAKGKKADAFISANPHVALGANDVCQLQHLNDIARNKVIDGIPSDLFIKVKPICNSVVTRATSSEYDESKMVEDTIEIAVQVNGKTRGTASIAADASKDDAIAAAKEAIADKLTGTIIKEIYVPGRIVNIVMK